MQEFSPEILDRVRAGAAREGGRAVGEHAVARGLLSRGEFDALLQEGAPLPDVLVSRGILTPSQLDQLCADEQVTSLRDASRALPPEVAAVQDDAARRFDGYVLVSLLGRGGFGEVWKSWDLNLGRWVAVKVLQIESPGAAKRFLEEASLAGRIAHEGVVPVHAVGMHAGRPYFVMRWLEGGPVAFGPSQPRRAVEAVRDAARAIQAAHDLGIVHLDLKPTNLLVGPGGKVQVADFGLAREVKGGDGASTTSISGTPAYMSPERAKGDPAGKSPASDIFSLGATLYHLAAGRPPYVGRTEGDILLAAVAAAPPRPRALHPGLHRDIETIILKAMEPDPARRYASAAALADDLDRFLSGMPIEARPEPALRKAARWIRRNRPWTAAAALVVVIGAGAILAAGGHRRSVEASAAELERRKLRTAEILRPATNLLDLWEFQWFRPSEADCQTVDEAVRAALEVHPASGAAWFEQGRAALMRSELTYRHSDAEREAVECFSRALQDASVRTRSLYARARTKLGQLTGGRVPLAPFAVDGTGDVILLSQPPEESEVSRRRVAEGLADLEAYFREVGDPEGDIRYRYAKVSATWYRGMRPADLAASVQIVREAQASHLVPAGESAVLLSNLYLAGNRLDEALQALDSALPRGGGEVSMFHQHRAHVYLLKIRKDSLAGRDVTDSLDRAQRSVDALVQLRRIGMALTIYLRLQGIRSSLLQRSGQSPEEISRKTVEYLDRLEAGLSTAEAWKEWALSCLGQAEGRALAADLLERSIRAAERALEKDPAITGMSGARGKARLKLSELKGRSVEERSRLLEAALQDLTAAVESRPRDSAAWQDLTSVRLSLVGIRRRAGEDAAEQIGEALTSAERSWALQPGGLETGLHRAHARLHAGDLGGSWADLHLVRELHGEASPMYRALRAALDRR